MSVQRSLRLKLRLVTYVKEIPWCYLVMVPFGEAVLGWETLGCQSAKLMASFIRLWKQLLVLLEEWCLLPFHLSSWKHMGKSEKFKKPSTEVLASGSTSPLFDGFYLATVGSDTEFVRRWKIHKLGKDFPHKVPENVRVKLMCHRSYFLLLYF